MMAALRRFGTTTLGRSPLKIFVFMYIESMQLSRYSELNSIGARTCYGSDIAYNDCRDKKDGGDYQ